MPNTRHLEQLRSRDGFIESSSRLRHRQVWPRTIAMLIHHLPRYQYIYATERLSFRSSSLRCFGHVINCLYPISQPSGILSRIVSANPMMWSCFLPAVCVGMSICLTKYALAGCRWAPSCGTFSSASTRHSVSTPRQMSAEPSKACNIDGSFLPSASSG